MGKLTIYNNCSSGLGNQLFQYAGGLYFERKWNASMVLLAPAEEHRHSEGKYPRPYHLEMFQVKRKTLPPSAYHRFIQTQKPGLAMQSTRKALALATRSYRMDEAELFRFHGDLAPPKGAAAVYLWGYWQAWQYVAAVEDALRSDFQMKDEPTGANLEYVKRIADSSNTVSVHLRRGDYTMYTSGSGATKRGLVLQPCYYERSIAWMRERLGTVTPVVFSDDQDYAREAIQEPGTIYVTGNDAYTAYEDLRLMSLCQNHIIANSSFSWWGAWRNPSKTKLVAVPKYWTNQEDASFPDLVPPEWTKIENL